MDARSALEEILRGAKRSTVGGIDAATTLGKNIVWTPVSGYYGLAKALRAATKGKGLDDVVSAGVDAVDESQALAAPFTAPGRDYVENIGKGVEYVTEPLKRANDAVGDISPSAGAAMAGGLAVIDPTKLGRIGTALKGAAKIERGAQRSLPGMTKTQSVAVPEVPAMPTERGGQGMLPGLERDKTDQLEQARRHQDLKREKGALRDDASDELTDAYMQANARVNSLTPLAIREQGTSALQRLQKERAGGGPDESIPDWLARTERIETLKSDTAPIETPVGRMRRQAQGGWEIENDASGRGPYFSYGGMPEGAQGPFRERMTQLHNTRDLVRQLRDAKKAEAEVPPPLPGDLDRLSTPPTTHPLPQRHAYQQGSRYALPAGKEWWEAEAGVPPSVRVFMEAAKEEPSALQFGTMPNARNLEGFAEEFGKRAKKPIYIDERQGSAYDNYDEPYKIETEKTHGRGEVMRDRYGDYKQEEKLHDPGDYPVYDDRGDVKKVEAKGPVFDPEEPSTPLMVKYRAEGGEPQREGGRYGGDAKYRYIKSEGGEPMRDERGNQKYSKEENPDYNPPSEDDVDEIRLSTDPHFHDNTITVNDPEGNNGDPTMYAMNAGDSGALLYQTYLAHASNEGHRIGVDGLTSDNAFRMLSNTLANAVRTGENPRDVSGTSSGSRPRARGFAKGDEIWRALAGEADARIAKKGGNPEAVQFNGTTFTIDGQPARAADIFEDIDRLSPSFRGPGASKVGPKSVMQNAVYKWLENASPEEARAAAKGWGKIGAPLFSGLAGTSLLAQHLRGENEQQD